VEPAYGQHNVKGELDHPKDKVENRLHHEVCTGKISLRAAQVAIAGHWMTAPCSDGPG
jgi:hypothetical protein